MHRKSTKTMVLATLLAGVVCVGLTRAQEAQKDTKLELRPKAGSVPAVVGAWTGDWGMYSP